MVLSFGFLASTLPVQILLPIIGWRSIFLLIVILIIFSIILIVLFIPSWETHNDIEKNKQSAKIY